MSDDLDNMLRSRETAPPHSRAFYAYLDAHKEDMSYTPQKPSRLLSYSFGLITYPATAVLAYEAINASQSVEPYSQIISAGLKGFAALLGFASIAGTFTLRRYENKKADQ
ncbi:hypothetical protein M1316_00830 [Candidatus Parvarchaeota archaeon]|nr:hypothetical protein [Candidatus Parvarchaeota archaeon]